MKNVVIYTILLVVASGCLTPGKQNISINPQAETYAALEKYLKTSDTSMRKIVENATGRREILATNIYNAYWIYMQRYIPLDVKYEARKVLFTNPSLTAMLLHPLLFEKFPEEPDPSEMMINGDAYWSDIHLQRKGQDCFFGILTDIAQIEDDGYARSILQDLAGGNYGEHSKWARAELEDIDNNRLHYKQRAEDYRKTREPEIIDWFAANYFWMYTVLDLSDYSRRDTLSPEDVTELLGPADYDIGGTLVYRGKSNDLDGNYIWMHFFDGCLIEANWGQKPGINKDDEKGKSSFWFNK